MTKERRIEEMDMNNMMIRSMLITYAEMGIVINEFYNTDNGIVLLFTVPESSYHIGAKGAEMSGKHLASRVKCTLEEMGVVFADIRYHIRNEHWDEEKAQEAKKRAYKDIGYKDWQIGRCF